MPPHASLVPAMALIQHPTARGLPGSLQLIRGLQGPRASMQMMVSVFISEMEVGSALPWGVRRWQASLAVAMGRWQVDGDVRACVLIFLARPDSLCLLSAGPLWAW